MLHELERYTRPLLHICVIHMLRQRMLVMRPIDPAYAVRHYVRAVRLLPADNVAVLFRNFRRSPKQNESLLAQTDLLPFHPHLRVSGLNNS